MTDRMTTQAGGETLMHGATPQLSQQQLNRIAIGRYLLSSSPMLSSTVDALAVAQSVLIAHDASELILSALATAVGATFKDKHKTYLMNYVEAVEKHTNLNVRPFFNELNEARVAFKHFGILPNPQQFHQCVPLARTHLDSCCVSAIGISLENVNLEMLIEGEEAQKLYKEAKHNKEQSQFKEALESLGRCLYSAIQTTPLQFVVQVGETSTEAALHMLAYGVDPSSFISLQEFLPTVDIFGEVTWNTRKTGHPGNWTADNVDFCLDVALRTILQIQHAQFTPAAVKYEYVFEDVLTAKRDDVVVSWESRGGLYGLFGRRGGDRNFFCTLEKGQQISGRATPALDLEGQRRWEETYVNVADFFVVSGAKTEISGSTELTADILLFVPAHLVELSSRVRDNEFVRERFPHLFASTNHDGSTE